MRTNRANNNDEPRHRKAGPARLGGGNGSGRRARDLGELEVVDKDGAAEVEERSA